MSIQKIKEACKITDSILKKCIKNIKGFETEKDIYDYLKKETFARGCKLAFDPVVAIGRNGAEIHHKACRSKLKKGFLVIDFGVKYKGHCADMTRTLYFGRPSKEEMNMYDLVLLAQQESIRALEPGMNCFRVDGIARSIFGKKARYFRHGLGHGVGRKIHQTPSFTPWNKQKLKNNAVLTIEPGLYFKNRFGIRIEDTILLKDKPIVLTKTKKELIII